MKVLVVNAMAPFIWGGAEELANNLKKNLIFYGHEAEILRIPFQWEPADIIPSQILMVRAFELWNVDRVIALKFPAYFIQHPNKTLWVLHQYRQAYDLFDAGQSNLPPGEEGEILRAFIKRMDLECFQEAQKVFTNSEITQQRMHHYNNFSSEVLPPPINDAELFHHLPPEGYIFAGGRINSMKRQYLLLEALALLPRSLKLVIAGPPDNPPEGERLKNLVAQFNLEDRVVLDLAFLPREKYASYINRANAVAYLPYDEDSLGYVAMEAAAAGKPLITTSDSGGILGLAKNGETGWVCEPTPHALANVLARVGKNPKCDQDLGFAVQAYWLKMGINWENTVEKLIS